ALRAVGLESIELADQARLGPIAIHLEAVVIDGKPSVQPWPWDSMPVEEREERFLQRAPHPSTRIVPKPLQAPADDHGPSMARVAFEQCGQRHRPIDPEVFH